ncbi:MAG: hypothetical protein GF317_03525 [Candidatus Lokiarchaeota archaeon]|nr:hypothetical protein [Candidatus Lokiarchaeota archaeon]MBD3198966.1 hypothetical protein [Candidatus Lokiarchaeota archaeon]
MTDKYFDIMQNRFGDWGECLTINDFMLKIRKDLTENGFLKDNSRLVFSVCPDDVNRIEEVDTIEDALTDNYNGEFHLGGLGGYPMGGVSGITAASHHPPDKVDNGTRKDGNMIFFISPHMGIVEQNELLFGKIIRPGQEKLTSSCGAMMGFLSMLEEAGSLENFQIAPDDTYLDPTRIVLHNDLLNNYADRLEQVMSIDDPQKQVVELFKLNYDVVANKGKNMIDAFLEKEKEHFKGNIALISGITVNVPGKDHFVLKDLTYPRK